MSDDFDEMENVGSPQQAYEMYALGQASALDDIYSTENIATDIKRMEDKIDFYKGLKKKRAAEIDAAIGVLENKIEFYKTIITKTLQKWKEKTVNFPGVCKISCRKSPPTWTITEEEEFIKIVTEEGEKDKVLEEIPAQIKIIKKEVNKLLGDWEKAGKIPPCVIKEEKDMSVSITFYEPAEEVEAVVDNEEVPQKEHSFEQLSL